jgi:secondary thiamine-phosphate synthase enzyme
MEIIIRTNKKKQVADITEIIEQKISMSGVVNGLCHLFVKHTTAALTTADLDPGTDLDMLDAFEKIIPSLEFRHPHNPRHAPDHILSSIIGPSLAAPVKNGKLDLGMWQRLVLIELDGPRDREIVISFI